MIKRILSISGRPGLYRLVTPGKKMLIVESIADGKRLPLHPRDKAVSLSDISMYTTDGDLPLADVLEATKAKANGQPIDIKKLEADGQLRTFFGEIIPNYDEDRVKDGDIRKLFSWYNQLIAAGVTEFKDNEIKEDEAAEAAEAADEAATKE